MTTKGNMLLVANWESDVGYAWWLMENFWISIAESLAPLGIKSTLMYPKITHLPESIEQSDIEVLEFDCQDRSFANLLRLRKLIKTNNIKYVYFSDYPKFSVFYAFLHLSGVKSIIVHDHSPGERTRPNAIKAVIKKLIQRLPLFPADQFIAVTEFILTRFREIDCIPADRCHCAANGIVPIDIDTAEAGYAYRTFSIPENRTIVVTTGRATYYKGIDFFIDCANELINNRSLIQLHFLFCGDGPDIEDFKQRVTQYGLDDSFTFAGKRSDIRDILPSCHIGLHTSLGEVGYSLSILEYMSAGLLTIVPNNPSTSLATIHGKTGYLYRQKEVASVADIICNAIANENSRQIAENAVNYVKEHKNILTTNETLKSIIKKIITDI